MSSFSSVVILNKSVDLGYILLAFFWVVFFMDSCLHIRIRWTRAPKEDIFCLTASEIFLDLPVCTKNHDNDIGIVVMDRSKKCTSHQLLTEKLLDLTSWQWYNAFVKVRGDSIPGLFLFMELWWDCWIGGSFLPNIDFRKYFFSTWKKTALLKPLYYEGVHGGRNGADQTAAAGSILSTVFLCAALPIRKETPLEE